MDLPALGRLPVGTMHTHRRPPSYLLVRGMRQSVDYTWVLPVGTQVYLGATGGYSSVLGCYRWVLKCTWVLTGGYTVHHCSKPLGTQATLRQRPSTLAGGCGRPLNANHAGACVSATRRPIIRSRTAAAVRGTSASAAVPQRRDDRTGADNAAAKAARNRAHDSPQTLSERLARSGRETLAGPAGKPLLSLR